jgi:hypothetical protein
MGYVKEFRMEYQIGEDIKTLSVQEKEFVNINASDKKLKVLKAVFGKFKPETKGVPKHYQVSDVTEKIKQNIATGEYHIPVNNQLIEGYIPEGENTELKITFKTNGEERTLFVSEGKILNLSKDIPKPEVVLNDGEVLWITPYPGKLSYRKASGKSKTSAVKSVPEPILLAGAWDVVFALKSVAQSKVKFEKLVSWTDVSNEDIQHFSGTASYHKTFQLSKKRLNSENKLELDLGSVAVIAEVIINGKHVGTLWKAPFRLDITNDVKSGKNTLELQVTNLWPNRLIGDEKLPFDYERNGPKIKKLPDWLINNTKRPSERTTFPSWKHWDKKHELLTSGLLGPVKINIYKTINLKIE